MNVLEFYQCYIPRTWYEGMMRNYLSETRPKYLMYSAQTTGFSTALTSYATSVGERFIWLCRGSSGRAEHQPCVPCVPAQQSSLFSFISKWKCFYGAMQFAFTLKIWAKLLAKCHSYGRISVLLDVESKIFSKTRKLNIQMGVAWCLGHLADMRVNGCFFGSPEKEEREIFSFFWMT